MAEKRKIRYALAGLGWIAQKAVLPAFENSGNSELVALVTGDPEKARELSEAYDVPPDSTHMDFTVRAARVGVHVLCEKPMADTSTDCEAMIRARAQSNVRLMIAYRLKAGGPLSAATTGSRASEMYMSGVGPDALPKRSAGCFHG